MKKKIFITEAWMSRSVKLVNPGCFLLWEVFEAISPPGTRDHPSSMAFREPGLPRPAGLTV